MTKDVEGSVVFVSSLKNATDCSNSDSSEPDSSVQGILVRNATKTYGIRKNKFAVLHGIDMRVKKGTIYGLLGASGCGKTTLLSCLVGRRRLNSGEILVLGHEPGSPESGIPGPRVGYMPQELALFGHFSINETLHYFGRIYNLKTDFVTSQLEFLSKLLDLPPSHRYVGTLSGGQQRRVSFAVALFHEPELLILDEPTVGVDPLLRHSIWNHLVRQSVDHGRTIIVTTHYIEEARQANAIGLMRSGRLLAEDSPENLLRDYNLSSLEDVFLKLCMADCVNEDKAANRIPAQQQCSTGGIDNMELNLLQRKTHEPPLSLSLADVSQMSFTNFNGTRVSKRSNRIYTKSVLPSANRLSALIRKNGLQMFRNIGMLLFIFLIPAIQVILSCLSLGGDPSYLKLAIVNDELDPSQNRICNYTTTCTYSMFSCRYLRFIDNTTVPFESVSEALPLRKNLIKLYEKSYGGRGEKWESVGRGPFPQNFTDELVVRRADGKFADKETILASRIAITLDSSSQQISLSLKQSLIEAFEDFSKDILAACSYEPTALGIPVTFLDPIYGESKPSFVELIAPGILLSAVYFIAVSLTTAVFLSERKAGLFDRSIVAGVQMSELMIAHVVNQLIVLIGQTIFVYIFALLVFKISFHGSLALAVLITLLQGLCGMSLGLMIASLCDELTSDIQLSLGSIYVNLFVSGVLWPTEGMPVYLRYFCFLMPQTYAIESLRNIFSRGWGIERPEVYGGVLISFGWIFALLGLSLVIGRIRKLTG
ncbi:ABC protein, subfamily ABCH [Daphnia pulex]|uniref:ABC protein, subfamily ABCH n=1 Tax=Daphnia pulex TaxID=6669 RepID=E9G809_DAPPU|nr:ABC protein, subfamily ABCH [Daphnia pulex]|eukprot:EFX84768.1 ABC protein, subfamily ABCH [Daphnia pulex]